MKIKIIPVGSMTTKTGAKLFFYFVEVGTIKVQASSFNKELVSGDKVLMTKNGQYWNLQSATGAPLEVELLNEVTKDE